MTEFVITTKFDFDYIILTRAGKTSFDVATKDNF
jgi:hypothetical protein